MKINQISKIACLGVLGLLSACSSPAAPNTQSKTGTSVTVEGQVTTSTTSQEGEIYINQVGYSPSSQKIATLVRSNTAPIAWQIRNESGDTVLTGQSTYYGLNTASGQTVHTIDFSSLDMPGEGYALRVGAFTSPSFKIDTGLYGKLTHDALLFYPHSRSGVPITSEFATMATPVLTRKAGHVRETVSCFAGEDRNGTVWQGCDKPQDVSGGWYDAGDYGKYTVGTGYAVWMMLNTYERFELAKSPKAHQFQDGRLSIPERHNGQNDLLDIARTGIEFMLKMQINDDTPREILRGPQSEEGVNITRAAVNGMVYHKVHADLDTPIPLRPVDDDLARALYTPSTASTLHVAAIGAQCARIWANIDEAFAKKCQAAATRAYDAALLFPDVLAYDINWGGGGYEDDQVGDEFFWATAEMMITTGAEKYSSRLNTYRSGVGDSLGARNGHWAYVEYLGLMSIIAQSPRYETATEQPAFLQDARAGIVSVADRFMEQTKTSAYGLPYDGTTYYWGSNGNLLSRAMILASAYQINGKAEYHAGVLRVMDYLLGRNPMGTSYISGYGSKAMQNPHHRFWANSKDANLPKPHPGTLSGGPNSVNFIEPVSQSLEGKCTGQTCWIDNADAYPMNEVSIVWNAPLFWVAAFADDT